MTLIHTLEDEQRAEFAFDAEQLRPPRIDPRSVDLTAACDCGQAVANNHLGGVWFCHVCRKRIDFCDPPSPVRPDGEAQTKAAAFMNKEHFTMAANELAVYQRIVNPLDAIKQLGTAIAKSRLFNCENEPQGEVLAMECLARGIPPLMLAEDYHIIEGKLSMRADAMLAGFLDRGGKHKVIERSTEAAEVELTFEGQTLRERLTWEEAQQEPYPFAKDGKTLKKNWATPRARRQMLWARVVSEAVRTLLPSVNRGRYTPEEMGDLNLDSETPASPVIDAPFKPADAPLESQVQPLTEALAPAHATVEPADGQSSAAQVARIKELWGLLDVSIEDRNKQLARRNASVVRNLTAEQAAELIGKLEAVYAKRQAADAPCSPEQVEQVKAALKEANQLVPGLIANFREKLAAKGLRKIEQLSAGDVQALLLCLEGGELEKFLGESLWQPTTPSQPEALAVSTP